MPQSETETSTKDPLARVRNQLNAIEYAPHAKHNLAVLEGGPLPVSQYIDAESGISIPLIDIYVNDACNLRCHFCPTQFGRSNLPMEAVPRIARLNPRVITLTGGGEPTIYRSGTSRIGDFIASIRDHMGDIPLGMMTNGTYLMPTAAAEELEWLRVSLNASTQDSYHQVHRRDLFRKVLENVTAYLRMKIPRVGIGFVYTPQTVKELTQFAEVVLDEIFPHLSEADRARLTLQFRPEADPDYRRYVIDKEIRDELLSQLMALPSDARRLLEEQSNIEQVLQNACFETQATFRRCFISVLQMNIDGKGDVYPCPQKAHAFQDSYGNIMDPQFFDQLDARLRSSVEGHTCQACPTCAQSRVNNAYDTLDWAKVAFDRSMQRVFF